jgi:hypothetical protein
MLHFSKKESKKNHSFPAKGGETSGVITGLMGNNAVIVRIEI